MKPSDRASTPEIQSSLATLENGLTVGAIMAHPVICCESGSSNDGLLTRPDYADFDYFPVRDGQHIIGLAKREHLKSGASEEQMTPLHEVPLVASTESLIRFLPQATTHEVWLVLVGSQLSGIVTYSDFIKHPVRILAFTMISHLEIALGEFIREQTRSVDAVLDLVSPRRRDTVEHSHARQRERGLNLDIVEAMYLCDKLYVCKDLLKPTNSRLPTKLGKIEDLRNDLAHARAPINEKRSAVEFVTLLGKAQEATGILHDQTYGRSPAVSATPSDASDREMHP